MKRFKELLPAIIISAVFSFMFFIYEPITMYGNNIDDFWFDLYIMMLPTMLAFLLMFIGVMAVFLAVYFLAVKLKKMKIYQYTIVAVLALLIGMYIQGNFLAGMLPDLDGDFINWGEFLPNFISIVLFVILAVAAVILCWKVEMKKIMKYAMYPAILIFIMLSVSLLTTFLTTKVTDAKDLAYQATLDNFNTASKNKNLMIFLVDAVDAKTFEEVINEDEKYKAIFDDFTYYPDMMSTYAFTRDSIPFILTGEWNENKEDFSDYSTKALSSSVFLNGLKKQGYSVNLYSDELVWRDESAGEIANFELASRETRKQVFIRQEIKYDLFKYLPYPLKRFSRIEGLDFDLAKVDDNLYKWGNRDVSGYLDTEKMDLVEQGYFQFVHTEGGHVPFDQDENLNAVDGTYVGKLKGSLGVIRKYIERLKKNGVYDNSAIIVMSDHGYNDKPDAGAFGRQNPAFYVKGIDEKHEKMATSEKPVSYTDLNKLYDELLAGKKDEELFSEAEKGRTRRFLWYAFGYENHMVEYLTTEKAWETDKMTPTGVEYNL